MECESEGQDRISGLPVILLHQILSRLPRKQAANASLLSKHWNSVWNSYPNLEFRHTCPCRVGGVGGAGADADACAVRRFADSVDVTLQRFHDANLKIEKFNLHLLYTPNDVDTAPRVDRWMGLVLNAGVKELRLNIGYELEEDPYFFVRHHYALPEKMFAGRFNSLRKLSLISVRLSETAVREMIAGCPNIECLLFHMVSGLETLAISKLDKLHSLDVGIKGTELKSIRVDAPSLSRFGFLTSQMIPIPGPDPCEISLASSPDLKVLSLIRYEATDDTFHSILSGFPRLVALEIADCQMLRRVKIGGQKLKRVSVSGCNNIETVEVDAPNLSSFNCKTYTAPVLLSNNVPCPMEIAYMFRPSDGLVSTSWFLNLREALGASKSEKIVTLYMSSNEVNFDVRQLEDLVIPPPVEVNHLKLSSSISRSRSEYSNFIDALLWSCHPKILSISYYSNLDLSCIKDVCEKLLSGGEVSTCCGGSSQVKCWRHELKSAELVRYGDIEDIDRLLQWSRLLDAEPVLKRGHKLSFKLAWKF